MTPIRVRGKKQKPFGESKGAKHGSTIIMEESSKTIMSKPARELSPLERLPAELLQQIFLQSLNLNLPRASPTLGSVLSSSHIKMLLVFKAFSSGSDNSLEHSTELLHILRTKEEIASLQSAILRLNWMTLDFFHQCIPTFLIKTLVRQFALLDLEWRTDCKQPGKKVSEAAVEKFVEDAYHRNSLDFEGEGRLGMLHYGWDTTNNLHVNLGIGLRDGLVSLQVFGSDKELSPSRYRWRLLFCLDNCQIPEKLLRGPWTDEKCDFLEIVTRGGASIGWIDTPSGEIAELGLLDALRERNQRAVEVLVKRPEPSRGKYADLNFVDYGCTFKKLSSTTRSRNLGRIVETKVRREKPPKRSVGVIPFTEHVRIAVVDEGFHKGIIKCLLSGDVSRIDLEDADLVGWGLRKKLSGDKHGRWLCTRLWEMKEKLAYSDGEYGLMSDSTDSTNTDLSDSEEGESDDEVSSDSEDNYFDGDGDADAESSQNEDANIKTKLTDTDQLGNIDDTLWLLSSFNNTV